MCCKAGKFIFVGAVALFAVASVGYVVAQRSAVQADSEANKGVIVATVGGNPVYLSEIAEFWHGNSQLRNAPIELVYRDILNAVLEGKSLSYQAKAAGIDKSAAYKKELGRIQEQALIATYIKQKLDEGITDEALKAEYEKFVKQNPTEDEVQASHILVDNEELAKEIIKEINNGADFAELAAKYSIDSNGKNGGKLNYFKKGDMVPEFANAVFSMNVGDVTAEPIKTMFGWHVVKVTDRRKSASPEFEQVKDYLKMRLSEELYPEIIKQAKKAARVVFMPAAYKNTLIDISDDDKPVADLDDDVVETVSDDEMQEVTSEESEEDIEVEVVKEPEEILEPAEAKNVEEKK